MVRFWQVTSECVLCGDVGPWFIGEVLAGHVGVCFMFGFIVNGMFVPTVLTYAYGAIQVCSVYSFLPLETVMFSLLIVYVIFSSLKQLVGVRISLVSL